ncbi:metabotropic glutamate receptor 3-like isoform X1, partial [Paramuricea clavata]
LAITMIWRQSKPSITTFSKILRKLVHSSLNNFVLKIEEPCPQMRNLVHIIEEPCLQMRNLLHSIEEPCPQKSGPLVKNLVLKSEEPCPQNANHENINSCRIKFNILDTEMLRRQIVVISISMRSFCKKRFIIKRTSLNSNPRFNAILGELMQVTTPEVTILMFNLCLIKILYGNRPSWVLERVFAVKTRFMCMGVMANRVEAFEKYLANLSVEKMENTFWFKRFYEQIMNCTFGNTSGTMQRCNLIIDALQNTRPGITHRYSRSQWQDRLNMNSTAISNLNLFSVKAQCSEQCNDDQIQERIHGKPICCWTCVKCPEDSIVMNKTSCHACAPGFLADTKRGRCVKIPEIYYSLEKRVSKFLVVPPLVFSFLGILGVIFTMCIFVRFNSNPLVKASGRELCYLLLTGLFLSFVFPIVSILRPSRFKCLAQFFLDSLPITISFVSIAVKTNRIFRIFDKNRRLNNRPLFMRPLHQIILSFLFIFIQILMLLILVIAQFPEENLVYFSLTEVHLVCSTSKVQILLSHLYNLILIVICTYYAFKIRHVPGPYNEAKIIAFAIYPFDSKTGSTRRRDEALS